MGKDLYIWRQKGVEENKKILLILMLLVISLFKFFALLFYQLNIKILKDDEISDRKDAPISILSNKYFKSALHQFCFGNMLINKEFRFINAF